MTGRFINNQGARIAYEVNGAGPLVVCVPSLGDVRAEYRFLAPLLVDAGYQVAVMDVRGHGETSTGWQDYSVAAIGADILALIRDLNAGPAFIIGTSMGGGAAVWAAVESPDLVSGLVLVDPFVDGDSDPWLVAMLSLMLARPWGPAMWINYYSSLYPTRKPVDFADYAQRLRENIRQPGRLEAVLAMLRASKRASGERLSRVSQPALVVMGSRDPDFKDPTAEAQRIAQAIHASHHIIPGAGHYPHAEMPEITVPLILNFINSMRKD
jgi:pimeloyl-ACP methyl ester carboxylesterase